MANIIPTSEIAAGRMVTVPKATPPLYSNAKLFILYRGEKAETTQVHDFSQTHGNLYKRKGKN